MKVALVKSITPSVHVPAPDFVMELDAFVRLVAQVTLFPFVSTLNAWPVAVLNRLE